MLYCYVGLLLYWFISIFIYVLPLGVVVVIFEYLNYPLGVVQVPQYKIIREMQRIGIKLGQDHLCFVILRN